MIGRPSQTISDPLRNHASLQLLRRGPVLLHDLPDLPADLPPLHSLDPRPHGLPDLLGDLLDAGAGIHDAQVLRLLREPHVPHAPRAQPVEQVPDAALHLGHLVLLVAEAAAPRGLALVEVQENDQVGPRQPGLGGARPPQAQLGVALGGRVDDARVVVAVGQDGRAGRQQGRDGGLRLPAVGREEEVDCLVREGGLAGQVGVYLLADGGCAVWGLCQCVPYVIR